MSYARGLETRLDRLKGALAAARFEGAVLVPGPNMRYLTGASSLLLERPFMLVVPAVGRPQLISPKLEAGPYERGPLDMSIHQWTDSEGWDSAMASACAEIGMRGRWGVEGRVPFLFLHRLRKHAPLRLGDAEPVLQSLREVKDDEEIRLLRRSAAILSKAFEEFPGLIEEGVSELEVARRAREIIFAKGATTVDDVLVQSGPRGADPHWLPSPRRLRRGEGVVIDISSSYKGYFADITRTLCLGSAKGLEPVYDQVLGAERLGIQAAEEGSSVGAVDFAARAHLAKAGLGKFFIHRTGHGLGLEVHEAPYITEGGKEKLRRGMCFTVEPGVYLKGRLGVRIEDNVLMQEGSGLEVTSVPKEFSWWR